MKTLTYTTVAAIVTASMAFTANPAKADVRDHIDEVALEIQANALELYREIGLHYRHTTSYYSMRSDAARLYRLAAHTHSVAHHGSLHHLENDLRLLDHYFHRLERRIEHVDLAAHHGIGGHVHGDTNHVLHLLHEMEDNIHHLRDDVESLTRPRCNIVDEPVILRSVGGHGGHGTIHRVHRVHDSRPSISFGGRGWRVRIGG